MEVTFVPHESSGALNAAVLGGHVDVVQGEPVEVLELIRSGDFRPLLVCAEKRIDRVKEFETVPTSVEMGYDVTLATWRGFSMKKGTPQEVIDYLASIFEEIFNSAEYQEFIHSTLLDLRPGWLGPQDVLCDRSTNMCEIAPVAGISFPATGSALRLSHKHEGH